MKIVTKDKQISSANFAIKRLFPFLRPHKKRFLIAVVSMVLYGATDGAIPIILKSILDDIFGAGNEQMLWVLVVGIIIFSLIRAVFGFLHRYYSTTVGLRIIEDLRNHITTHLLKLSPSFYSKHSTGSLVARMTNDTLLVRRGVTEVAENVLRDGIRIIALFASAVWLDPVLACIACVAIPFGILPVVKFGKRVRRLSKKGQEQFGGLTSILQELIVGHRVVQAFSMEQYEEDKFSKENRASTATLEKAEKYGALSGPSNEVLGSIAVALVIVYGGLSVIHESRTQGEFIAFISAMLLLYEPVKRLSRLNVTLQQGVAAAERVFEILDEPPEIVDSEHAIELSTQQPSISFKNVYFKYPEAVALEPSSPKVDGAGWTLENINLQVPSGSTIALVGASGGGKSTLVNLLPRFYDIQQGSIEVEGKDIRDYTLASLRRSISIVSQHTFLFNDTVYNNIAYGRLDAPREKVIEAAKAANAHEFIEQLPQGYDTIIGEQGLRLSGGQRARIAIARALVRNAPILILDEATASLDSESEGLVQQAIETLCVGRTVLVIAHRLATVRRADKIVVIVGGKIVEQGTHRELLSSNGEYAKLHVLQFENDSQAAVEEETETRRIAIP